MRYLSVKIKEELVEMSVHMSKLNLGLNREGCRS